MHASLTIATNEHQPLIDAFLKSMPTDERANFVGDLAQYCAQSAKAGSLFIVITGEVIVAMSSLSPLTSNLVETRTCFVAPEYRGFGLQRLMHEARAVVIQQRWGLGCAAVSAVKRTTMATVENLLALGFKPWEQPHPSVFDPCHACDQAHSDAACCCNFFLCESQGLTALSGALRRSPIRKLTGSRGRVLVVDCSSITLRTSASPFATAGSSAASGGPPPAVFWLTGISGAGKSTIARSMERLFGRFGWQLCVLDGDDLRAKLNADLGFSDEDRAENVRRIAEVAALMADAGLLVAVSCISPKASFRKAARRVIGDARFIEVYVDTPLAVAEARDPKGLYGLARSGKIMGFTGVHASYEEPSLPEVRIDTMQFSSDEAAAITHEYYVTTRIAGGSLAPRRQAESQQVPSRSVDQAISGDKL